MPGILPMKVIRVGSLAQSRIAQACDRCRSKKIRCDGIRPCCTQCSNVGFECKTSDKLSRRAFPRGYTESLEDRVRGLEAEVRELKDLLDEKDEKIDMLSRIHSFSSHSRKCSESLSPAASEHVKSDLRSASQDFLQIETPAPGGPSISPPNQSSTAALIASFDRKVQESGKPCPDILPSKFSQTLPASSASSPPSKGSSKIPPRLLSDQYINIFFQEWAPLLPVLHRPTFLRIYEEYLSDPEAVHWHSNKQAVAQLFLIFEVAALSSVSRIKQSTTSYEPQWRKALQSTSSTPSVATLQCHVLAQLYYLLRADYSHLARHRAIGVSICHQLGLHQHQKSQTMTALDSETRKKAFWSQYVLDKFASAASGAPMLLRDADISTEYPKDVDDENITHQGLSPTLPGELTKISSALALFKASRILARTLEELYPASATYQLSLKRLRALSDELDQWSQNLPSHLRLQFLNDKPSTGVISCRSPLLSLAYFFTRGLIHRPLVCHGSGSAASASIMATADSAKHVVQILDLLDERRMNYAFPFNKSELLLTAGFSLLWQCLELPDDSKLVKDNQKSLVLLTAMLTRDSSTAGNEFQVIAESFVNIGRRNGMAQAPKQTQTNNAAPRFLETMPAPGAKPKSARKQLQAIASRFSSFNNSRVKVPDSPRRATVPCVGPSQSLSPCHRAESTVSLASTRSAPVVPLYTPSKARSIDIPSDLNLDYLPIGEEDDTTPQNTMPAKPQLNESAWEQLLTNIDSGHSSIYNGVYGGTSPDDIGLQRYHTAPTVVTGDDWAQEAWPAGAIDLTTKAPVPQSVLSFSEDSVTSGEDLLFSVCGSNNGSTGHESMINEQSFKGIAIPNLGEDFDFDDFDTRF